MSPTPNDVESATPLRRRERWLAAHFPRAHSRARASLYPHGESEDFSVRSEIPSGGRTRLIDLPGHRRVIESISMWYSTGEWRARPTVLELENGKHADASSLITLLLESVRAKYGRIPPGFASLMDIKASLHALRGDSAAKGEYRAALATLAGGTRLDSAALPSIVAHFAKELQTRGKIAEADAMLRRTLAWLPPGADSASAVMRALQAELRDAPPIQHASPAQ